MLFSPKQTPHLNEAHYKGNRLPRHQKHLSNIKDFTGDSQWRDEGDSR